MKRKLLIIDTETSGLDPQKNCILSLAAVVYHDGAIEAAEQWPVLDALGEFDPEALALNGFTHERVLADGISPWGVIQRLEQLLLKHDMRGRVVLAGHNLPFDVGFLKRLYRLAGEPYELQFSYGGLDTKVAALMLEAAGRIAPATSSLVHAAPAVGVAHNEAHDALADAMATAKVLKRMIDLIRHTDWPPNDLK
jgi:DNA polymerase-3 subunit epsilon